MGKSGKFQRLLFIVIPSPFTLGKEIAKGGFFTGVQNLNVKN